MKNDLKTPLLEGQMESQKKTKSSNKKDLQLQEDETSKTAKIVDSTFEELNVVSNPNLSVEMFLIRLLYLKNIGKKSEFKDTINNEYEKL